MKLSNKHYFIFLLVPWVLFLNLFLPVKSAKNEFESNISPKESNEIKIQPEYIIGPGDFLAISISNKIKDLNQEGVKVDIDGMVALPFLKRFKIEGLTINQANKKLNEKYSQFIIKPDVRVSVTNYRDIKVFIDGESNNTGMHSFDGNKFVTLFEVIKQSGGVTNYADLTNIKVTRLNKGGERIFTSLNLKSLIESGDSSQNIRIFDKDTISISKSDKKVSTFIRKAIRTNLNPQTVGVYVMGNVRFPGIKSLSKQSGVIEAIEIAGGYNTPFNGNISFIRFNADGSIDKRKISPRTRAKRGSYMNPYLLEGDIVSVKLGRITKTANVLRTIADPFAAYLQILGLYEIIKD